MKSFKYLFLFAFSFTISITSCSKKDEATISKSQLELLTSHQWKYSSQKLNGAAHALLDCEKDDHFSYSADGIYTYNPGLVICDFESIGTSPFSLSYDMKTIIHTYGYSEQRETIVELTANKLVTSSTGGEGAWEETYIPY